MSSSPNSVTLSPKLAHDNICASDLLDSTFVRDVTYTVGTRVAGILAGMFTLTVTARLLGPDGRGQFAILMATLGLVLQFSNFGLHASSTYYLARKPGLREEISGLLFWFSFAGVGLVSVFAYGSASLVPSLIQGVPFYLMGIVLLTAPPAMYVLLSGNALLGLGRADWFNGLDLATKVTGAIAVLILFWWTLPVFFGFYAMLYYLLAGVAYLGLAGRRAPGIPNLFLAKDMFGYGTRAFLTALFTFLVLRIDLFLVNDILGAAATGQYSVAVQTAEILSLGAGSIAAILFPQLSGMSEDKRWPAARRVAKVTALLLAGIAVALGVISRPLLTFWFGSAYLPAVEAFVWLLPGLWCLGVNTILYQYLAASGMPWFLVGATFTATVSNLVLNMYMIPAYEIVGAAAASSLTYGLLLGLTSWYICRGKTGLTP